MSRSVRLLVLLLLAYLSPARGGVLEPFGGPKPRPAPAVGLDVAVAWANLTLDVIRSGPSNSPTYASRSLGYMGVAMYESVVHSDPTYRSLAGQVSGLTALPRPEPAQTYHWPSVLNASQALLLYRLYPHAYPDVIVRIDSLQRAITARYAATEAPDVVARSLQYGWGLAIAIFEWSKTDGGHEGYSRNFALNYPLPTGAGYWIPPDKGQSSVRLPLHATWGSNRTFVPADARLPVPPLLPYATDPASAYYREYAAVHKKSGTLTPDEKRIALWWSDDPALTLSPPGHSYNVATTVIRSAKPDLVKAAQTYARVGMAVADAFINCWKCKYTYHRERPSTFIRTYIQKDWQPFWPEPPFPAFPSGHSTQAAAAATVLADLYGSRFAFTDSTHCGRRPELAGLTYEPRQFPTFWASAVECANSRFYGGIHTDEDNRVGLAEGKKIGRNVNALAWRK